MYSIWGREQLHCLAQCCKRLLKQVSFVLDLVYHKFFCLFVTLGIACFGLADLPQCSAIQRSTASPFIVTGFEHFLEEGI